MTSSTSPGSRWFAVALLAVGSFGFAAAWVLLAFARDRQCSWMAMLAAIDAVFLLRLSHVPSGWQRSGLAVAATAATIVLANWGIAAAQIGRSMGMLPWDSLTRLGPFYAWTLANLVNLPADLAWLAASLVLAAILSR
jgi:hypothetical protein